MQNGTPRPSWPVQTDQPGPGRFATTELCRILWYTVVLFYMQRVRHDDH